MGDKLFSFLNETKPREQNALGLHLMFALASSAGGGTSTGAQVSGFSFQAESDTLASSFSTPPTTARKRTIDRAIRRLKTSGLWAKATAIYMIGADQNASLKNWKTPGTFDCTVNVGATFAADDGWTWDGVSGHSLNTNMPCNTLSQNDNGHFVWSKTGVLSSASRYGAINASSNGISLAQRTATSDQATGRAGGPSGTVITTNNTDGIGLHGISRSASNEMIGFRNGVQKSTVASVSAAMPTVNIHLLVLNNNGTIGNGVAAEKMSAWWFGQALNETEVRNLTAIFGEYLDSVFHGEPIIEEVGVGTAVINAQCIAYGFTMESLAFCVSAKREGKTVAIAGGWRDRWNFGGMASGGLGYTDFDSPTGLGGFPRWLITRCNELAGTSDVASGTNPTAYKFQPKFLKKAILEVLEFYNIPLYQTGGVDSVSKSGTQITSFHTADGRTFTGSQFYDGSYEKDLARRAGLSYRRGREAAGSGVEANNGYELHSNAALPLSGTAANINVDPWVIIGNTSSGLLPNINYIASTFTPALHNYPAAGSVDTTGIPAYNFRLTFTNLAYHRVPLPSTPPPGFDAQNYEIYLRWIDNCILAGQALQMAHIFKLDDLRTSGRYDLNKQGILSTNLTGENHDYPLASYADRELIWKQVWNHIMGLWYVLQYHSDARINGTALRTEALTWGMCQDHYFSPHENDSIFHMPQMYVRESIRVDGDVLMNGNHMTQTDGQVPTLGDKTISCASYGMDSHSVNNIAQEVTAGNWSIRAEGGLLISSGGANNLSPLPFGIAVPKISECTNLSFGFGLSTTHVSFGTTRMEFTACQTGQSMGHAASLAIDGDNIIQNVDYPTLRTAILASPELTNEVAPVLPQLT